jgi:hypothetical protein
VEINEKVLVLYLDLEGGIFVLKNDSGAVYFPVNLQDDLKKLHGKYLQILGKAIDSESFQMNGLPILVEQFSLIN